MFEKVNAAYEFLCSKSRMVEGPDPNNIVLILRAQSILFSRYKDGALAIYMAICFDSIDWLNVIHVIIPRENEGI